MSHSMIRTTGYRFSKEIALKHRVERDSVRIKAIAPHIAQVGIRVRPPLSLHFGFFDQFSHVRLVRDDAGRQDIDEVAMLAVEPCDQSTAVP